MKRLVRRTQIAVIWALTLFAGVTAQAQPQNSSTKDLKKSGVQYVDQQVIVKFNEGIQAGAAASLRSTMNATVLHRFSTIGAELWQISGMAVDDAIAQYRGDPRIKYIEPNYLLYAIDEGIERVPNDPRFQSLWGLNNTGQTGGTPDADIDAPEAWDIETGDSVLVGVIDTGVDYNHQDLAANIWTNPGEIPNNGRDDDGNGFIDDVHGYDFVNNDGDPFDDNGHGTHVSGTIAGVGNNGVGVVGVSWSARIMGLKFLSASGSGSTANAIRAVEYATMMNVRFTSNSWGGGGFSQALYDAIAASGDSGMLFIAAAGNTSSDNDRDPHYPSSYDLDNIIAVAATDHNDRLGQCSASNWGLISVDLGAPGDNILSTTPGNTYSTFCGTSMATPHVSGVVSLIWSRAPALPHLRVKELIMATVDPIPALQGITVTGGRLNAFRAVSLAQIDSIPPAPVTDLATTDPRSNFITLTWTASGDDGNTGKAAAYDIRYSTAPINSGNFDQATRVFGAPEPQPAGSPETFTVGGLNFNTTYFFALKVIDEQGNASEVSNSPSGTTLGIPVIAVTPGSFADTLLTGASSTHTLTISNVGAGTLDFNITITGADSLAVSAQINSFRARQKTGEAEPQDSHRVEYEAYKNGASGGVYAPAQPVANPGMMELYRRFLAAAADSTVIFHDDMEQGVNGWSHYSTHANGIDQWGQTSNRASSGVTSWQVTQHDFEGGDALQAPSIDLTGYENATLTFMHWHNFDDCEDPTFDPDGGILEISSDGGASWTQIFPVGGYPYILDNICFNPLTDYQAYAHDGGNGNAFIPAIFDLTPYAGNPVLIRWQAGWDCGNCALNEGWYVDDVTVYSTSFIGWLSANPDAGTVFASNSIDVTVTLDATGLNGGDYAASLVISSNDPVNSTKNIPVNLHVIGAPDIALSDTAFDFGSILLGDTAAVKLTVANPGTDLLTGNIVSDNSNYTVSPDTFSIDPKRSQEVLVRFIPSALGEFLGVLTITSNDPDEPVVTVRLRGEAVPPPVMAVFPDSLRENLLTGQTSKRVLTITNSGGSDLKFALAIENAAVSIPEPLAKKRARNLAAEAQNSLASGGSQSTPMQLERLKQWGNPAKARPANAKVTKPRKKNSAQAVLPVVIEDPAGDGGVVDITTVRGLSIGDELHVEMNFATVIDPADFGGYFSVDIDQNPATGFPPTFGLPEQDIGAEFEFFFFSLSLGVIDLYDIRTGAYVFVGSYEVEIQPNTLRFSTPLADLGNDDGNMDVTGVLGNSFGPTDWFPDAGHGTILTGVTWVTVAPDSGVVPPGASFEIEVTFDATGLIGGDYTADLVVASNDPKNKRDVVDVHLQVTDAADIAATPDTLNFGQVFIGVKKILEVVVQNKGTVDLLIPSATTDQPVFKVFPTLAGIDPGETEVFKVRFLPTAAANYAGTLTLTSNDPDEPNFVVTLLGQGIVPPDIEVSPLSFAFNLNSGDSAQAVMTIANVGGSPLDFTIRDVESSPGTGLVGQKLYWTEPFDAVPDTIHRSNLDGTGIEKLITSQTDPLGIEIDVQGGRIYWAEIATGSISSSRLDGSDAKTVISNLLSPVDIAIDPIGGKMYWTDFFEGTINRANLDGSDAEIIVQGLGAKSKNVPGPKDGKLAAQAPAVRSDENALVLINPWGIALDLMHGKVYWTEQNGSVIGRANLDGSGAQTIISSGLFGPRGIKVDAAGEKIYFVDSFNQAIKRANLDGRNVETLLQFNGNENPLDIDLDLSAKQFYWSDNSLHLIQRANFDGSNVIPIISEPSAAPFDGLFGVGLLSGTNWLTETPLNGRIQPDSTLGIDIKVNTKGLNDGDYTATILVASNDPDEPEVPVSVTLHVTGVPRIAVSDDTLDFGEVFTGFPANDTLIVSNVGTKLLSVTGIASDLLEFTAAPSVFDLNPEQKQAVVVTFKTDSLKTFSGQLAIASNDPDRPSVIVVLLAKGVKPPDIAVRPDSLSESLFTGEISTQTLTISNKEGGSDLNFDISIVNATNRSAVGNRRQDLSSLQKEISGEVLSRTSSYGAAAQTLPKKLGGPSQLAADILLITTTSVRGSVEQVLNNLGRPYDFLFTDVFTGIDFSPYTTVIVAMDGGFITEQSVQALAIAAESGKKLIMLGGTNLDPYYQGIQAYLLSHTGEQGWAISQTPHLRVTDPTHPLAADLPSIANFNTSAAAFYMLRVDDPLASTAAINGDDHPILLNKTIGDGTLIYFTNSPYEFYWGDPSDFAILQTVIGNALEFLGTVSWLSADPISGTVPAGDSIEVAVTFDATGLKGGDYFADLLITSNDPDEDSVAVPAHLHVTGAPAIAVSRDTLDYGLVFIGATATDTLEVSSIGTDSLVVSDIVSDNADYQANPTRFNLAPGATQEVLVTFSPSATGVRTGILRIVSNAQNKPDLPVALLGTGAEPPDIVVMPDSLRADLFTGADTTQILKISNIGKSDLIWQAAPAFASRSNVVSTSPVFRSRGATDTEKAVATAPRAKKPEPQNLFVFGARQDGFDQHGQARPSQASTSLEEVLANLNQDFADVTGIIPNRFDFSEGESGYFIDDGGLDMYDGGNALSTNFGFPIFYSDNLIIASPLLGGSGRYFTRKYPGLFVFAADMDGVTDFVISGNLGADGAGNVDGVILEMDQFGTTYQGFVKRVYNAGDPSVNHLIIIEKDPAANHEFAINTDDDFHDVFNLANVRRLYYLLYAGANGFYIDNTATLAIMDAFLQAVGGVPPWLTVTPNSGIVPPDSSVEVEVKFDATGLVGGDYRANILISSNDPDESIVPVPTHLHVTGRPVIAVSDSVLEFGPVFIGVTATDSLIIFSRGTDSLKVSSIVTDNPDYTVSSTSFTLAPGESRGIEVSFTPSAAGQRNGTLTIASNDPANLQLTVPLFGEGVEPPVISVSPAAFELRVDEGDSTTAVMTISNNGGSPLNFKIRDEESPRATAANDQKLYWTESLGVPDTLHRSNLDGSNVESLFTNNGAMRGIVVDDVSGRLYWADRGDFTIRSSRLDGSDRRVLYSSVDALDLAIDRDNGKIYWTNFGSGAINQANLDGSGGVIIIVQGTAAGSGKRPAPDEEIAQAPAVKSDENALLLFGPWGIALDLTHGKVYWTEQNGNRVGRANLDGSGVETIISFGLSGPRGIKLDVAGGKIYFIDSFNLAIKRANLDGSQVETLIPFAGSNPLDLELDLEAQRFYWTDNVRNQIFGANLDGSNVQVIVNSNRAQGPLGIGLSVGMGWLTEAPTSGTVAAGSSQDIQIKVDASELTIGNYSANILIESNDPDPEREVITVPVTLHVTSGDLLIAIADTLHGVPNETVDVPVFLTLNRDTLAVAAFGAALKATNQILSFAGFTPGPLVQGQTFNVTAPTPDSLQIAFLATSGGYITQGGLLATLRFQISPNALEGQTALLVFSRLIAADSSDRVLSFAADNGMLTVNKALSITGLASYFGTSLARPVADLDAKLTQNGTLVQATKTDAAGKYLLAGIIPGADYRVELRRPSGGIGAAVTPIDALLALRGTLNGAQKLAADVDGNLAVEQKDANMIFDFFLGLISQFPVEAWRTFPASYNINATPDAWKTAPEGIDYPDLRNDQTKQDYYAVARGDVDLDWSPTTTTATPTPANLASSSSTNAEAPLQLSVTSAEVMPGAKTITWQVHLDGTGLKQGVYALGADVQYDVAALEITHVRWGKSVPAEGFQLQYRVLPAATNKEKGALNGRLRFGGFSTAAAAIREVGAMLEVEAQLRTDLKPGASLPIRFANVSAVLGLSEAGLSKSSGGADFAATTVAAIDGAVKVMDLPVEFALRANYPNPFNPSTRIRYELPENAVVKLEIFNMLGQKVRTLVNGESQPAGYYTKEWNGRSEAEAIVPSGVYFYRFEAKGASKTFVKTHKMLMVK